jgi:hypothetical protein
MEIQVVEAALAIVRPTTDSKTRSDASSFLEYWNRSTEAWNIYVKWLQSFHRSNNDNNSADSETVGVRLLCLTLLLAKIRREVSRNDLQNNNATTSTSTATTALLLASIRDEAWTLLSLIAPPQQHDKNQNNPLLSPLCSCIAAIVIRSGNIGELVNGCSQAEPDRMMITLKLLASVPSEMEAFGELTTPQITAELWPHMELVLHTIRRGLVSSSNTLKTSLEALYSWVRVCHITLSHLNSPICGGTTEPLLPFLIQLLSQSSGTTATMTEVILVLACQALTEAILVPSDNFSPSREDAISTMLAAIPQHGFVDAPLHYCTVNRLDDGALALANLISTLVSEEVETLSSQPQDALLALLLKIQSHPHTPVVLTVLECWLTVQDIPTEERHENWKESLFSSIAQGLVHRLIYTSNFISWSEELELDEQEFRELRRMVNDVLVNCYFLSRARYLHLLFDATFANTSDWRIIESALFCLGAVSREVCARVKSIGMQEDRNDTIHQLQQFLQFLCGDSPKHSVETAAQNHPLVLAGVCNFLGLYAPAWNVICDSAIILRLLLYLKTAMTAPGNVIIEASKAIKSIFVSCASQLVNEKEIVSCLRDVMDVSLSMGNIEGITAVAEGSTRLILQLKDQDSIKASFSNLLTPLIQRSNMMVDATINSQTDVERDSAIEVLVNCLEVLHIIIRFCDSTSGTSSPITLIFISIWSLLEKCTTLCSLSESILNEVLLIHRQFLSNAIDLIAPNFPSIIQFVVEAFENTKHPGTLEYFSSAVETFSLINNNNDESFKGLLAHVTGKMTAYVTNDKSPDSCTNLIRAFFEMTQRYVLFCPYALTTCSEFSTIITLAVECLTACKGERESTRSTLIFISQLFGWKNLRLGPSVLGVLEANSGQIEEQLFRYGEKILMYCISGLGGSSPQMLWPQLSDCIIVIVQYVISLPGHSQEDTTIAHQWLYNSLTVCVTTKETTTTTSGKPLSLDSCMQIMRIFFALARKGTPSKPKLKMLLTDFARLCKGELAMDALITYTLDLSSQA